MRDAVRFTGDDVAVPDRPY